jgi:hypothetical protein
MTDPDLVLLRRFLEEMRCGVTFIESFPAKNAGVKARNGQVYLFTLQYHDHEGHSLNPKVVTVWIELIGGSEVPTYQLDEWPSLERARNALATSDKIDKLSEIQKP